MASEPPSSSEVVGVVGEEAALTVAQVGGGVEVKAEAGGGGQALPVFEAHVLLAAAPDTMKPQHHELLLVKPKYTMGRCLEADLCIKDVNVSRRHADFAWTSPGGWGVTNHSENGIWVNGAKVNKGSFRPLVPGDLVVLSDLRQLYSWTLALPGALQANGEPPAKRRRLAQGAEGAGDATHRHMVAKMEAWRAAAAGKLAGVRSAAAEAEREGRRKQEELEVERSRLLERLERQAAEGAAREEEARGALERRLQGSKEEQEEERRRLEERLHRERGEAEEDRRRQVQVMEARIEEEKEKLKKEVEERDIMVDKLKTEKLKMEEKFEGDKIKMENELKQLQTQLEEKKLDSETKEKMYKEKVEDINMRMEAELLEEKAKHVKEVAEQKEALEKEARAREEEREREREEHAVQLVAMREEQSRREEEVRLKSLELEQKMREQEEVEAKVEEQRRELERRQKEDEGCLILHPLTPPPNGWLSKEDILAKARALARARRRAGRKQGGGATPSTTCTKAGAPSTPSLTPAVKRGAARGRGVVVEEEDAVLDLDTPRRLH